MGGAQIAESQVRGDIGHDSGSTLGVVGGGNVGRETGY